MSEHIESMPILPIGKMLADADRAMDDVQDGQTISTIPSEFLGDLACHVRALASELEKACEAIAVAYRHLDRYGDARSPVESENEMDSYKSQERAFEALGPFVRVIGHEGVSIYRDPA